MYLKNVLNTSLKNVPDPSPISPVSVRIFHVPWVRIETYLRRSVAHWDLTTKKDFMEKYQKLAEIYSKNLENCRFLAYHPFNDGHVTGPWADKALKIVWKVVQEDFGNTGKKSF